MRVMLEMEGGAAKEAAEATVTAVEGERGMGGMRQGTRWGRRMGI